MCIPLPDHLLDPNVVAIPFRLRQLSAAATGPAGQATLPLMEETPRPNLSPGTRRYLAALGRRDCDGDEGIAAAQWPHALAVILSPRYMAENADGVRRGYPRVSLPAGAGALRASAALRAELATLLDTEVAVKGVSSAPREELRPLGVLAVPGGEPLDPARHLAVRAGWGRRAGDGPVVPGTGRIVARDYTEEEASAIEAGAARTGIEPREALALLGPGTFDISERAGLLAQRPRQRLALHRGQLPGAEEGAELPGGGGAWATADRLRARLGLGAARCGRARGLGRQPGRACGGRPPSSSLLAG